MVRRYLSPRMALLAGLAVSAGACNVPPKANKPFDEAAARWKAEHAVQQGVDKEKAPPGTTPKRPGGTQALHLGETIWIQTGKSRVIQVPYKVTRVSIGNPDLAGVVVLGPHTILINAKELPREPGQTGAGTSRASRSGIISARTLTSPPRMAETTVILWDSANNTDSHTVFVTDFLNEQVLLEVTIAELNRTKMDLRGIDFQTLGQSVRAGYWLGGGPAPQATNFQPTINTPGASSFLGAIPFPFAVGGPENPTFVLQNQDANITALVTMLQANGLATVLAQPKILALSGQNAVFQVGGEIPIRIVTSFTAEIEFRAFGTLVNFLPRISEDGDIVLTVTPEVSQPDFNNPVEGIPSFKTRRASTSAKLHDGETLVLGGLTQRNRTELESGIPYLKDVPYVGRLFRKTSFQDETTELMVIVTPRLVRNIAPGTNLDLPTDRGPLTQDDVKSKPEAETVTRPRLPAPAKNSMKNRR